MGPNSGYMNGRFDLLRQHHSKYNISNVPGHNSEYLHQFRCLFSLYIINAYCKSLGNLSTLMYIVCTGHNMHCLMANQ